MNALNFIFKDINSVLFRKIFPMKRSKRTKTSFEIAPSNITLEVLSNGSSHMSPSVFIRTPSRCYLFNCPEGTSRISNLLRLRPNQIQDIFITKGFYLLLFFFNFLDKWENIAGISGIILSKDYAEENIRLHGPPAVSEMIKSLKPMLDSDFANPAYPVRIENCDCKRDNFEDSTLFVHYLNIENSKEIRYLFNGSNSPKCTAFLVKLKPCLPPLDPLKLIELRIPRSPLISKLKFGETITLEDGRIIKPEDVIDYRKKSIEYPNLLVADICSFENIHSISENYLLKDFMSDNRTQQMNYIIHFTQQKIFESEEYKNWIKDFGTKCTHLVLNIKGRFLPVSDATHNIQYLLNSIFPEGFPEICPFGQVLEGQIILQDDEKYDIKNKIDKNIGPIYFPEFLRRFSLRGNLLKDEINPILLDFNWKNFLKERIKLEPIELQKRIEDFKQIYLNTLNNTTRDVYPTIIFLGTSSAVSTKYRNVSSYLVRLSDSSNFLVDCGEATYGQLLALFGPSGIDQLLTKLNALFITHSHLDHFLGIFNLIYKRIEAFEKQELPYIPLVLVHDSTFFNLFKNYSQLFLNLNPYIISVGLPSLFCETSTTEKIKEHNSSINLIKYFPKNIFSSDEWNLSSAIAFQVDHTKWSCGYSFTTLKEQRKIVFSGDTRPCENIIKNGNNADILIHECTFEDGLEKDALIKKHSTMRQAFDSSLNMGAKNVIFTHFSARYHLVPPLPDYIINAGNVSVANDLMVVPFDLLPLFPKLLPIYQYLYKEELFDFELKKNTRIANEKLSNDNNSLNSYILKHKHKASF